MSKIHINRQHSLEHDECRAVAENLLDKLVGKFGGTVKQKGDCYNYKHATGLSAVVEPKSGELDINVKLTMLTRSMGPKVEEKINAVLDEHMGEASV